MEEQQNNSKQTRLQVFYDQLRSSFFNIMFELLKEKTTSLLLGSTIIIIVFFQVIGHLFVTSEFAWADSVFLNFFTQLCGFCRLIGAINDSGSIFYYWVLMLFGFIYLFTLICLLLYMNYFLKNRSYYLDNVVKLSRLMILLLNWIFFLPFYESFISIVNCQNGYHYLDTSLQCYSGIHIFYIVICIFFLVVLFSITIIIAMLYNETQPSEEDCLSRVESNFEVVLVGYRAIIGTFTSFCGGSSVCAWILATVYIVTGAMLCYQYYKQIPYYNKVVSVLSGSLLFSYFWVALNCILMMLLSTNGVSGHIIVIFGGIPLIIWLVKCLREERVDSLANSNIEKVQQDIDALLLINNIQDFAKGVHFDREHQLQMIGVINMHLIECQNTECPCKENYELYDIVQNQFEDFNDQAPHQNKIFLDHLIKRLYEDTLVRFITSPGIHISFAFYLFKTMRNIHSALVELNTALKKKPSLQQQFTIFRYKNIIEEYIQADHYENRHIYPELVNVFEFERLFQELQKSIEKVCNIQIEFWTHLTTVMPDLTVLNDLGNKVHEASDAVEVIWIALCKINPNYQQAMNIFGQYLKDIRNHDHLGELILEKSFSLIDTKKQLDDHAKSSDVLFSDDTSVVHVSGNKETMGKIVKTSSGLSKVFGYSKSEVIGHSVNILMPMLFAKKHTECLERFFKTGRQIIFYQERNLFASHRNGHCFHMKILVKQMPNLQEGIQYVGMIKPIISENDYMLTDLDGVIDSFSKGVTIMTGLTPNMFKDKDTQINVQLIAPELIQFFQETAKRGGKVAKSKYRENGGDNLSLIVPKDFHMIAKSEGKTSTKSSSKGGRGSAANKSQANIKNRSPVFRQFLKCLQRQKKNTNMIMPTAKQLLMTREYTDCERRKDVLCEITAIDIKCSATDSMRMIMFKFNANQKQEKKAGGGNIFAGGASQYDHHAEVADDFDYCKQLTSNRIHGASGDQDNQAAAAAAMVSVNVEFQPFNTGGTSILLNSDPAQVMQPPPVQVTDIAYKPSQAQSEAPSSSVKIKGEEMEGRLKSVSNSSEDNGMNAESIRNKAGPGPKGLAREKSRKDQSESKSRPATTLVTDELDDHQSQEAQSNNQQSQQHEVPNSSQMYALEHKPTEYERDLWTKKKTEYDMVEDVEEEDTPRVDISGLKLEAAQQEKSSFLNQLKQNYQLSETSTQKIDVKDSISLSAAGPKPEKGQSMQKSSQVSKQSSIVQFEADQQKNKAADKPGIKFGGDRHHITEEEQDNEEVSRQNISEDSNEQKNKPKQQQNLLQVVQKDDDEMSDQEHIGKQKLKFKNISDTINRERDKRKKSSPLSKGQQNMDVDKSLSSESSEEYKQESSDGEKTDKQDAIINSSGDGFEDIRGNPGGKQSANPANPSKFKKNSHASAASKRDNVPEQKKQNNQTFNYLDGERQSDDEIEQEPIAPPPQVQNFMLMTPGSLKKEHSAGSAQGSGIRIGSAMRQNSSAKRGSSVRIKYQKMEIKKKDTGKLKTNPKYRCLDEESDDGLGQVKKEDDQEMSAKEYDFRETFLRHEKRRKRREKRERDRELKKLKALNGEDAGDSAKKSDGATDGEEDEEEGSHSEASISSSESDTKEGEPLTKGGKDKNAANKPPPSSKKNEGTDQQSSVSSRQNRAERNHQILRLAIDERFVPKSIKNIQVSAYFIFVIIVALASTFYAIQINIYGQVLNSVTNIHYSHDRTYYLVDVLLRTRMLVMLNGGYYNPSLNSSAQAQLYNSTVVELRASATSLMEAQTNLSLFTSYLPDYWQEQVNPSQITTVVKQYANMPQSYVFTTWEAIMEIVVQAYRVSTLPLKQMADTDVSIFFILQNSANSIGGAVQTVALQFFYYIQSSTSDSLNQFLYILIAASCCLGFSLLFMIPIINKVRKNKQEVLELFTHKAIEKHIEDQLKLCREFVQMRLQQNGDGPPVDNEIDEGAGNRRGGGTDGDKELQNEMNNNKLMKRIKKKNKGKKWKPLKSNFAAILMQFLVFIAILEGFFVLMYLLSQTFLNEVTDLAMELKYVVQRKPIHNLLVFNEIELFYSNGTSYVFGIQTENQTQALIESMYPDEENLLDQFSSDFGYHTSTYNNMFNNLVYSDMCMNDPDFSTNTVINSVCELFNQGILKKGYYSSIVKFWDFLRQIAHDFKSSNRQKADILQFLNDNRLSTAQQMNEIYINSALNMLTAQLESDIQSFFTLQSTQNSTIFIVYILYVVVLFTIIWRRFVGTLQDELWKTKSMLSILPTKLCFEIEEIRYFIYAHSSNEGISGRA